MFSILAFAALAFAAGPSGHYAGTKTVLFNKIKVDMQTGDDGIFSLKITGGPDGDVDCPNEAYTFEGDALDIPNLGTPGDCATEQFKDAGLTFHGATYDAAKDEITVNAKWKFVTVTVVCKKASLEAPLAAVPNGHYYGTKRVMMYKIKVDMATGADGEFSLKVNGAPSGDVDCPTEAWEMNGNELMMPNIETEGDCAHDQFQDASLVFNGATYDPAKDTVTIHAKWKAITVTIVCEKQTMELAAPVLAAAPEGHYYGTKRVMMYKIKVDMATGGPGMFSMKVNGAPSGDVDCPEEAWEMNGNELMMPNYETEGDCAHDQFEAASLIFNGATYDPAKDTVTIHAKWKAISVTIVCEKQSMALAAPVLAAVPEGHYYGTKRVMMYKIKVDMATGAPGMFSLKVNGAPSGDVDCPAEEYDMDGTDLMMPNYETAGDCAHDQFEAASLVFNGATYDPVKDEITMHAKWKAITVTIVATKQSLKAPMPLALPMAAAPTGHYYGTKRVMMYKIKLDMKTGAPGMFSLSVEGAPSGDVNCPTETWEMNGSDLVMPNIETEGDCAHDQFLDASLVFKGATYDAAKDVVTVNAKWKAIAVTIVCEKQSTLEEEATGSLDRIMNRAN